MALSRGVRFVLVFIGVKMLLDPHGLPPKGIQIKIESNLSLIIVGVIIAASIALSVVAGRREKKARELEPKP